MLVSRQRSNYLIKNIISEPKHISGNWKSCIDFVFTFLRNMVMGSGGNSPLHPQYHH